MHRLHQSGVPGECQEKEIVAADSFMKYCMWPVGSSHLVLFLPHHKATATLLGDIQAQEHNCVGCQNSVGPMCLCAVLAGGAGLCCHALEVHTGGVPAGNPDSTCL